MSFLPPVVLEIRAQAAQFFAETMKVTDAVRTMADESGAAAAGMSDKVSADTEAMGNRVSAFAEAMATRAAAEAESMASRVVAESEQMDTGATAATDDMVRKVIAGFEAMSSQAAAAMERQSQVTVEAMETTASRVSAAEEKTAAAVEASTVKIVEALSEQGAASDKAAAQTTASGLKMQETFVKTAATAVSSTGTIAGALTSAALKQSEAASGAEMNLMGIANGITKVAAVTAVVVAGIGLDMAAHFQKSTELLVTAGGESQSALEGIRQGILNISSGTGTSAEQLSEGMYVMEKAGYRGAAGLAALQASAEGAKAENVDLGIMTQATTDILLDYGYKMGTADDATKSSVSVVNQLVAASGAAKTTMTDFAASMAAVVPIASAAHISFDQVGGAIATMTQHGQTAQQSSQNLANLIQALIRPNNLASNAMQQMGIDTVGLAQHLGDNGLSGTLKTVSEAILKHMGPDGQVVMDTMKNSASATADLRSEMAKMPPDLAKLSQSLLDGSESQKDYQKAAKDMGGSAGAVGDQFLSLYKASQGVNDAMKNGQPSMMTYQAALTKVLGNVTAARAATMLLMNGSDDLNRSIALVSDAADKGGNHISTWAETQKQLSTQLDMAKQRSENLAISIGTKLIPVANGALTGFQDLLDGFEKGNPVLVGIATLITGVVTVAVTNYTAKMVMAGVATLDKMIEMGAGAIAMGAKFVAGFMTSEVAVGEFATKAELAGAKVRGMGPALGMLGIGVTAAGLAFQGLAAAQEAWGHNNTAPKANEITDAMANLAKTADAGKAQVDNMFKDWDSGPIKGAPSDVHNIADAVNYLNDGWAQAGDTMTKATGAITGLFGVNLTSGMDQVKDRMKGIGDQLGTLVNGGQIDTAATDFNKLTLEFQKNGKSAQDALDTLPGYKQSLVDLAAKSNLVLNPQQLLELAMGKIPDVMKQAAGATKYYSDAAGNVHVMNEQMQKSFEDLGIDVNGQITDLGKLYDAMVKTGLANLSARDAEFHFGDAISKASDQAQQLKDKLGGDLSSALDGATGDFNKTTAAGQEAEGAFSSVAQAGLQSASVMAHDVTKSQEDVQKSLQGTYYGMIATAEKFGMNSTKAEELTRSVLNIPPGVKIDSWMSDAAKKMAEDTKHAADNIDGRVITVQMVTVHTSIDKALHIAGDDKIPADIAAPGAGIPGGFTGGAVSGIMGMYDGGVIPGNPPTDPHFDNIRAMVNGKPLNVQSGEFLVNGQQTKANLPWLKAINGGLNMSDFLRANTPQLAYATDSSMAHSRPQVTNNDNSKTVHNSVVINSTADANSLATAFSRMTANQ